MQHGTPREYVLELVENAHAILGAREGYSEVVRTLGKAMEVLDNRVVWPDMEERSIFGPDYAAERLVTGSGVTPSTVGHIYREDDYPDTNPDDGSDS